MRCALLSFSLVLALLSGCAFVNVPLISPPSPLAEQVLEGDGTKKILSAGYQRHHLGGGEVGRFAGALLPLAGVRDP